MAANLNKISQKTKHIGTFSSTFVNFEAPFYDFETPKKVKAASKREESRARLSSPEREQTRP
jgi:hypothetical protein